jgi:hypothetical protein
MGMRIAIFMPIFSVSAFVHLISIFEDRIRKKIKLNLVAVIYI